MAGLRGASGFSTGALAGGATCAYETGAQSATVTVSTARTGHPAPAAGRHASKPKLDIISKPHEVDHPALEPTLRAA